jgi:hypothetical protein
MNLRPGLGTETLAGLTDLGPEHDDAEDDALMRQLATISRL